MVLRKRVNELIAKYKLNKNRTANSLNSNFVPYNMGRYARLRARPVEFHREKKALTIDVDWDALAAASVPEGMALDPSSVKVLQTLALSAGDVNSVAIGKNYVIATGSG